MENRIFYWNNKSALLNHPKLKWLKERTGKKLAGKENVFVTDILSLPGANDVYALVNKEQEQDIIDEIELDIIPQLRELLGGHALYEGVDVAGLERQALLLRRVRLLSIVQHIEAFQSLAEKYRNKEVRTHWSFHYTDLLLRRVFKHEAGKVSSRFSWVYHLVLRLILFITNVRAYKDKMPEARFLDDEKEFPTTNLSFLATMETHVRPLMPVMHLALKRGEKISVILPDSSRKWEHADSPPEEVQKIFMKDFISADDLKEYETESEKYSTLFKRHQNKLKEIFVHNGIDYWDLVRPGMKNYYEHVIPLNKLYVRMAERIIDLHGIQSILGARILKGSEAAFYTAARLQDVRTGTIQHGLLNDDLEYYFRGGRFDLQGHVYVWSKIQQTSVLKRMRTDDVRRVLVTGNPRWDELVSSTKNERLASDEYTKVVSFCAQPSNTTEVWQELLTAAIKTPQTFLYLKSHPAIPKEKIQNALKGELPKNFRVIDDDDIELYTLLRNSDLTITIASTVLFESLVLGTPILLYKRQHPHFIADLQQYGAPAISTPEELQRVLGEIKTKEAYMMDCEQFQKQYLDWDVSKQGHVSENILRSITQNEF